MSSTNGDHSTATDNLQRVLSRLENVTQTGDAQFMCRCPCHDDRTNSLAVCILGGRGGRIIGVRCHADCPTERVVAAIGLQMRDLFPPREQRPQIEATYDFCNADGSLEFQEVRFKPKAFRQRSPLPDNRWDWSVKGCKVIPYRLPELLAADPSAIGFICEGPKDCDNVRAKGLTATTNAGGAGKWRKAHSKFLTRRHVAIIADNDDPGRAHAEQVAQSLDGIAASIKVLHLPGLPEKGDISDWFSGGGTAEQLLELVAATAEWTPSPNTAKPSKRRAWKKDIERAASEQEKFTSHPLTDLGNAERFVEQHGKRVRFVATWDKWLVWDGTRWRLDTTRKVCRLAKKTVRSIYFEVAKLAEHPDVDPEDLQELTKWAKKSEKRERIAAMIALAASEEGVAIDHFVLDTDPWLLNCANGTIDLHTGNLREHDPADLLTKTTGVEFPTEPGVDTPIFDAFLESTFLDNVGLFSFLRRLIGYAAVGVIQEHVLAIFWGAGSNGKSTLLNAILNALGDYGFQAPQGFLMVKRGETHPTDLTDLFGARFVSIAETQDGQRLDEGLVKMLTGGERVRARRMREDFWEFTPSHTPFLATNYKPIVRGGDYGIWRRLKLIPFEATFVDPTETSQYLNCPVKDSTLPEKLKAEAGGILRWIVQGCLEWQRSGLNPPDSVLVATRAYKDEQDTWRNWFNDRCEADPEAEWKANQAYLNYRAWSEETGERPMSRNKFADKVEAAGFERLPRRSDGFYYAGFRLNLPAK